MSELTFDTLMDDPNYLGSERARMENKVILDELERKKKARAMAVPTDDNRVKARLREIGEPITLFGERVRGLSFSCWSYTDHCLRRKAADRRDRLIYVLSQINAARGDDAMQVDEESSESSEEEVRTVLLQITSMHTQLWRQEEEEFYTPSSLELIEARRRLAEYSLPRLGFCYYTQVISIRCLLYSLSFLLPCRAQKRVAQQRIDSKLPLGRIIDIRKRVFADVKVCVPSSLLALSLQSRTVNSEPCL